MRGSKCRTALSCRFGTFLLDMRVIWLTTLLPLDA